MTHLGEQEPAGALSPSLNRSKWEKGNENRRKRKQCLGEILTLGKNIGFKGTNPVFFPPLLSKKTSHPCTAPKGDVCTGLGHCSVSIPPAPRLAKMQVFFSFFTQILGHLLGGAGKSGCKQAPISCVAVRWAGHTWNATIPPSSGTAE